MQKVKINNRRAGTVKLPGGKRLKRGASMVVPVTMLMHKSLRKLISSGRMQVSGIANKVEAKTDSLIHSARDAVDAMIDNPALEEASDKILDAVEDAVESAVDSAIDAAEDAAEAAIDTVAEMLGLDDEPAKEEKPKRKTRRKKSDS